MPSSRFCAWLAGLMSLVATISLAVGVTTPVRSGPNCRNGCVPYPYTDAAAYVPRDYLWMYPAILTAVSFVVLAVCLTEWVPANRRWLGRAGTCPAGMGACALVVDYALQLTVVQPGLQSGETAGLSPLTQYNPHGLFIGLENAGYAILGAALVFLGAAIRTVASRRGRLVSWLFTLGGGATLVVLILFGAIYRARLDYRFEVVALGTIWLVLIASGALLAIMFAHDRRPDRPLLAPGQDA